jgi:predicted ArsR family transcriptional regulator
MTEELVERFLSYIKAQVSVDQAAFMVGVNPRTVRQWLSDGEREIENAAHSVSEPVELGRGISRSGRFYLDYQRAAGMLESSAAVAITKFVDQVTHAQRVDAFEAAMVLRILERMNPRKWGKKSFQYQRMDTHVYLERLGVFDGRHVDGDKLSAILAERRGRLDDAGGSPRPERE